MPSKTFTPDQMRCVARPSHQSDLLDTLACKFWVKGEGYIEFPDINKLKIQFDHTMIQKTFGTTEEMIINFPIPSEYHPKHAVCKAMDTKYDQKNIDCWLEDI